MSATPKGIRIGFAGLGRAARVFHLPSMRLVPNVVVAGGLCVALAVVLDIVLLALQRAVTPWTRAVPTA